MRLDNGLGIYKEFGARRMLLGSPNADIDVEMEESVPPALLATFNDLAKAGFEQASAIINVDNVITNAPKAQTPFGLRSIAPIGIANMELTLEHAEDELAITIEFDRETGNIIGWEEHTSTTSTAEKAFNLLAAPLHALSADGAAFMTKRTTFSIPLTLPRTAVNLTRVQLDAAQLLPTLKGGFDVLSGFKEGARKVVTLFVFKKVEQLVGNALLAAITLVDQKIKPQEVLQLVTGDLFLPPVSQADRDNMSGKNVLLLVHGIISSTKGAFDDLIRANHFSRLSNKYEGRIVAYDHWTLSKSTFENAEQLAAQLPSNTTLDIICHSRGAGVVRALLENPQYQTLLKDKGISVGQVIFVAGACEGSPLAKRETVDRLFKIYAAASHLVGGAAKLPGDFFIALIKLLLRGLQELPGTDSVDPDGKIVKALAKSTSTLAQHYGYIRANSDFTGAAINLIDEITIDKVVFSGLANDVIVPFAGAGPNNSYLTGQVEKTELLTLGAAASTQSDVWHITFFKDTRVREKICEVLGA